MDIPTLTYHSFETLGYPSSVARSELEWVVQVAAAQLYGHAFVDFGDISDFNHGHVLWDPLNGEPMAVLFHTQEFPNLRSKPTYVYGDKSLDPYDRSWVLWLKSKGPYLRGQMISADLLQTPGRPQLAATVSADMLDPALFGADADLKQLTFLFFRVPCKQVRKLQSSLSVESSNVLRARVATDDVCAALVNTDQMEGLVLDGAPLKSWENGAVQTASAER